MDIVVTGAAGFLGTAVVAALRGAGETVVPVSRRPGPGITVVADYSHARGGDVLVHTAEEADRAKVNALGPSYALHAAEVLRQLLRRAGHVVYASSGVVYGDECERPFTTDDAVRATDTYSRAKVGNEQLVLEAGGTVLRLANLCGRGMSARNVLSDILRQIPGGGPLEVRDDSPVRDFLPVTEAAAAVLAVVRQRPPGVLNVGSGIGLSVREVAHLALGCAGQAEREIVARQPASRRSVNILDIAQTRERLGWSPRSTLQQLLEKYFQDGVEP